MSMTESDAIEILLQILYDEKIGEEGTKAFQMAIHSLEEIQQYREYKEIFESHFTEDALKLFSDKEEFSKWFERGKWHVLKCDELGREVEAYRAIGTVSEFRELKEKETAKKPIYSDFDENEDEEIIPYKAVCPACGYEFEFGTWNDEQNHHCECGQRMLWD